MIWKTKKKEAISDANAESEIHALAATVAVIV